MSYLTDYIARIRTWVDDEDIPEVALVEWVRDAEERLNNELRTDIQITRTYATFDDNCALLPEDWLETKYVRLKGGRPFDFISNHDYWDMSPIPAMPPGESYPWPGRKMLYTHIGRTIFVWPPINVEDLTQIEIAYYRAIVPLGDVQDPILARYPSVFRYCTLAAGAPYLIEDERMPVWGALATAGIQKANEASKKGQFSGSPIAPRIRGFG